MYSMSVFPVIIMCAFILVIKVTPSLHGNAFVSLDWFEESGMHYHQRELWQNKADSFKSQKWLNTMAVLYMGGILNYTQHYMPRCTWPEQEKKHYHVSLNSSNNPQTIKVDWPTLLPISIQTCRLWKAHSILMMIIKTPNVISQQTTEMNFEKIFSFIKAKIHIWISITKLMMTVVDCTWSTLRMIIDSSLGNMKAAAQVWLHALKLH